METAGTASVGHSELLTLPVGQVLQLMGARDVTPAQRTPLHVLLGEGRKKKNIKRRMSKKSSITTGAMPFLSLLVVAGCAISSAPAVQHSPVPQESAFGSLGQTLQGEQK